MVQKKGFKIIVTLVSAFWVQRVIGHLKNLGEDFDIANEYKQSNTGPTTYIKGGVEADRLDFPFNVIFINFGGVCGGTILARKVVLTAGHCFTFNKKVSEMKILSNARHIYDFKSTFHLVWDYRVHEDYGKMQVFANDIAIILIHDNFIYTKYVQRAFMINTDIWMNEIETNFIVSGWGRHEYTKDVRWQEKRSNLMETRMRFVKKSTCERRNFLSLSADMFCLYGDRKRDTCQGDSGGSVLWRNSVVGIVSHGQGCGEEPSMYTNVYYMQSWIKRTILILYEKFCKS